MMTFFLMSPLVSKAGLQPISTWGDAPYVNVVTDHRYAYLTALHTGIDIWDMQNPEQPLKLSNIQIPGEANRLVKVENRLYVAAKDGGLQIVDVTQPSRPLLLGGMTITDPVTGQAEVAQNVLVRDQIAYLGVTNLGVFAIDISDPQNPQILGSTGWLLANPADIAMLDRYLYICLSTGLIVIYDTADPTDLQQVGLYAVSRGGHPRIAIHENLAYLTGLNLGLEIIDLANPAQPLFLSHFPTGALWSQKAIVRDEHLYLPLQNDGVQTIDVSNPRSPSLVDSFTEVGQANGLAMIANHLVIADSSRGMAVAAVAENPSLSLRFHTPDRGSALSVAANETHAYLAHWGGLKILDTTTNLSMVGAYDAGGHVFRVAIQDDLAAVAATTAGFHFLDISDPANPQHLSTVQTPDLAYAVQLSGDHAYLADGLTGLSVVDISDPSQPVVLGVPQDPFENYFAIQVVGHYAYIGQAGQGLKIVDISDPSALTTLSRTDTSFCHDLEVESGIAYLADGPAGLRIFDVADPATPVQLALLPTPDEATSVRLVGRTAYVAVKDRGMLRVDVQNPAAPQVMELVDSGGRTYYLGAHAGRIFACGENSGRLWTFNDPLCPPGVLSNWSEDTTVLDLVHAAEHTCFPAR